MTELVLLVLKIEGIALAALVMAIFAYAAWSRGAREARARRLSTAKGIIAGHLEDKWIADDGMTVLRGLAFDDQRRLFFDVATSVGPTERAWLRQLAKTLGTLDTAISGTRSSEWWTRLWSARLLTLLDADPAVMHPLLQDPDPMVRASIATYIAQHPTREGIEALIAMLSDPRKRCRLFAKDALMRLGGAAMPTLLERLTNPDDAQTIAMLEVASAIGAYQFLPTAVAHAADPRPAVRLMVIRLLRGIGGSDSAEHLTRLIQDPDPVVRAAAAEALGYLSHWTASSAIARLLDDEASRVRLAAALSLAQLGPAGELLLRRARSKGSERAAAAASRVLLDPSQGAVAFVTDPSPAEG